MPRIAHAPRSSAGRKGRAGVMCLLLMLCGIATGVHGAQTPLAGQPIQAVLDAVRDSGIPIVYSTALVTPDLVVKSEPLFQDPLLRAREVLEPHGLTLLESDGLYLVVRAARSPGSSSGANASTQASAIDDDTPRELEPISVSASRYLLWSNSNFYIDQRAIQALPDLGEDPVRTAQRLPGAAAGGLSSRSHFRGGEHNETAIYLNGLKLLDPFHIRDYHNIFSTIDARAISGIEAYTGGYPAAYGDQMSGMLLMETREPEAPLATELGLSVYNTSILNSGYRGESNIHWLFSARRSNLDAVLSDSLGKPDYFDVFASLGWAPSANHALTFNVLYADDDVTVITEDQPDELEQSVSSTRSETLWLTLDDQWTPYLSSRTTLSWTSLDNSRIAEVNDPDRMQAAVRDLRDADILGLEQHWQFSGIRNHLLSWGFSASHQDANYDYRSAAAYDGFYEFYPGITNPTQSRIVAAPGGNGYSLFVSDRWQATENTGLQFGLRWDRQDWTEPDFSSQLSPRISVLQRLGPNSELRLTWGRYYQSQSVMELQVEDGLQQFFAPQRADHWIAGFQHRFANGYRLRLEAFDKQYDHLKPRFENQFDPLALIPELAPDRLRLDPTSASARGVEITLDHRGQGDLEWWASYSYARAYDVIDGEHQPRSWDQRHALQAGLAWRPGAWEVGLALSVHSGWPTSSMAYNEAEEDGETVYIPVPGPRNAEQYSTFAQLDFRVSRAFEMRKGRLSLFFEVTNATNRMNPCCSDYDIEEDDAGNVFLDYSQEEWLPILPAIGLHWSF